jgi:hypothetical protein
MNDLIIKGVTIRVRDESLCTTDLWRAGGSPPNKEPYQWARKEGKHFIEFVAENLNLPVGQVWITKPGRHDGGTWSYEKLALAYAEYLNHEFHAHVLEVYAAWRRCELVPLAPSEVQEITPKVRQVIGGIVKQVVTKQVETLLAKALEPITERLKMLGAPGPDLTLVTGYVGRIKVAEMAGIISKSDGRTAALTAAVTREMNKFCLHHEPAYPIKPWRNIQTDEFADTWPIEAAAEWLSNGGRVYLQGIAERRKAKIIGQGRLPLKIVNP